MSSLIALSFFFGIVLYYNVPKKAIYKYKQFRKINKLVSVQHKDSFKVFYISVCIVLRAIWINIWQYLNNSVVKKHGKMYEITYIINGNMYKMIVKPNRGPKKVMLAVDKYQNDISHKILPYLGPEENFHNKSFTPSFFGEDEIMFELSDGKEIVFNADEKIEI